MVTISIVTAYYNQEDMTKTFLDNLMLTTDLEDVEVILVNAASKPIEHKIVTKRIDLEKNESFSNSMNAGIKETKGDYVLIIGNDVFPRTKGWLNDLYKHAEIHNSAITCPTHDNPPFKAYESLVVKEHKTYYEMNMYPAVCWLIKREVIDKIGLFDEQFTVGCYEDNDYVLRVLRRGGKIVVVKDIKVKHLLSQTLKQFNITKAMEDNRKRYHEKWKE